MKALLFFLAVMLGAPAGSAQEWEAIKADGAYIWGEGWGGSVEEADRQALAALTSRISVVVTNDFRQVEEQVLSSEGDGHYLRTSNRSIVHSCLTLSNTHRTVLKKGRKAHVGRWIHRDELERIFAGRKARILEYEQAALLAEQSGRVDEALRCHYWAYVLLCSLQRPSELREPDGGMLLNRIPERLNAILEDLSVGMTGHDGDVVSLRILFRGMPARGMDFSYFDGSRWLAGPGVRDGISSIVMAPGALAETILLRVEYAYRGDSMMDAELRDMMEALDLKPLKKSFIFFRTL